MLEEQEKTKRLEDERYEQQLRERYLKVRLLLWISQFKLLTVVYLETL